MEKRTIIIESLEELIRFDCWSKGTKNIATFGIDYLKSLTYETISNLLNIIDTKYINDDDHLFEILYMMRPKFPLIIQEKFNTILLEYSNLNLIKKKRIIDNLNLILSVC